MDYLKLLYHGKATTYSKLEVNTAALTKDEIGQLAANNSNEEFGALAKLYVLCEKIRDPQGKTSVLTTFIQVTNSKRENGGRFSPSIGHINKIYAGTMDGDPLRRFCADCYAVRVSAEWFTDQKAEDFNHQFVYDVMTVMASFCAAPEVYEKTESAEEYCKTTLEVHAEPSEASGASQT
jgi:hypothetical protein